MKSSRLEEIVAITLVFIILMSLTVVAFAYALPTIVIRARLAEVTTAIATMERTSQNMVSLLDGDSSSSILQFSFAYGVVSVTQNGYETVTADNTTLYNAPHEVFSYEGPVNGFPSVHVLDMGATERAYYDSPEAAGLVYHYSKSGATFVVSEEKVSVATIPGISGTVVHILVLELQTSSPLATKTGAFGLTINRTSTTAYQYSGRVAFTITSGEDYRGDPLTSTFTISGQNVIAYLTIFDLEVATA